MVVVVYIGQPSRATLQLSLECLAAEYSCGADTEQIESHGRTALHVAALIGQLKVVRLLLGTL